MSQTKTPLKFETIPYADVSTSYLEPADLELIGNSALEGHIFEHDEGWGTIFYVPLEGEILDSYLTAWQAAGLSQRFITIMTELACQKIQYVRFDADGGEIEGMEKAEHDQLAHRRNPDFCAKCGGECQYDDDGVLIQKESHA